MSTSVDSLDDHLITWINNTKICGWRTTDVIDANKMTDSPLPISLLYHGYTTMDMIMATDDDVIARNVAYYGDGLDDKRVPIAQLCMLMRAKQWIKYLRHQNNWDHYRFSNYTATKITYDKYCKFCNDLRHNKIDLAIIQSITNLNAPSINKLTHFQWSIHQNKKKHIIDTSVPTGTDGEIVILFDPLIDGEENKRRSTYQRTHQNVCNNEEERNDNANSDIVMSDERNDNATSAIVSKKGYKDIDDGIRTSRTHDEPDDDCDTHHIVRDPRTHDESEDVRNPRTHDEFENNIDHRSNKERWKDINNNNANNESNIDNNTTKMFIDDDEVAGIVVENNEVDAIVAGNDDGLDEIVAGNDYEEYGMIVGKYESVETKLIGDQRTNDSNVDNYTFTRSNESMKIIARCEIDRRFRLHTQSIWNDGQQHEGNSNTIIYQVANNDDDEWSESSTFSNDNDDSSVYSIDRILDGADQEEFETHHPKIETYPCMLNSDDSDRFKKPIINIAPAKEGDQVEGTDINIVTKRDLTDLFLHAMKLDQLYHMKVENEDERIEEKDMIVDGRIEEKNTISDGCVERDEGNDRIIFVPFDDIESEGDKERNRIFDITYDDEVKENVDRFGYAGNVNIIDVIGDWEIQFGITTLQKHVRGMLVRKRKILRSTTNVSTGGNEYYEIDLPIIANDKCISGVNCYGIDNGSRGCINGFNVNNGNIGNHISIEFEEADYFTEVCIKPPRLRDKIQYYNGTKPPRLRDKVSNYDNDNTKPPRLRDKVPNYDICQTIKNGFTMRLPKDDEEFEIILDNDDSVPTHLQVRPQQNTDYYRYYLCDPTYGTLLISPLWKCFFSTSQYHVLCTETCGYLSMSKASILSG